MARCSVSGIEAVSIHPQRPEGEYSHSRYSCGVACVSE